MFCNTVSSPTSLISSRMWCVIHNTKVQVLPPPVPHPLLVTLPWSQSAFPLALVHCITHGWVQELWGLFQVTDTAQTRGRSCPGPITAHMCVHSLGRGDWGGAWCCAVSPGALDFPPGVIGTALKPSPARGADISMGICAHGSPWEKLPALGRLLEFSCRAIRTRAGACHLPWVPLNWDQCHWSSLAVVSLTLPRVELSSIWTVFLLFCTKSITWALLLVKASQRHLNSKVPFLGII